MYVSVYSCPFDYIKVYDGPDNEAEEIDTYCGSIENRTIFSTGDSLNIVFETKSGRPEATKQTYLTYDQKQVTEVERRGFQAVFEISDLFVNLGMGAYSLPYQCESKPYFKGGKELAGLTPTPTPKYCEFLKIM